MENEHIKSKSGYLLMIIGLLLIGAAFLLTMYNFYDDWRAGRVVDQVMDELSQLYSVPEISNEQNNSQIPDYFLDKNREMPTVVINGTKYSGTLNIPSLNLSLPIIHEWSYSNLKTAPCRYAGTAYKSGFVIAGHNYSRHFGTLTRLKEGVHLNFTDVEGNEIIYKVAEIQVLEPQKIKEMLSTEWDLSLFTCTMSGQTRFTVRCKEIKP